MSSMRPTFAILILAGCTLALSAQQQLPPGAKDPDEQTQTTNDPLATIEDKISQKDYKTARFMLDAYLTTHSNDARALFDSGFIDDTLGKDDAAAAAYRRSLKVDPNQFEPHLALGLLLARINEADEARSELLAATKLEPAGKDQEAKARAWRALAQLQRANNPSEAKQALLQALKISPETVDDTLLIGEIAEASDDDASAEAAYKRVLQREPNSAAATSGLAHLLLKERKMEEAEPLLRKALEQNSQDPALTAQLASILLAEKKNEEALNLLTKAHEKTPKDTTLSLMLADAFTATGNFPGAIELYRQLIQVQPNDPDLLNTYGQGLIRQQKFEEAIGIFEKATHLDPKNVDAWSGLAFAASEAHQPQITLSALDARTKLAPDTPPTYFLKAAAYDTLHQDKAASEAYRQFLNSSGGKFPNQEWQAKQRLALLEKTKK